MLKIHRILLLILAAGLLPLHADPFPPDLPTPDRAEIMSLDPGASEGPKAALNAAQVDRLIPMIRALTFTGPASCDKKQYVLLFYAKEKLVAADGMCFHCGCLVPLDSDLHAAADALFFDTRTPKAQELASFLAALFSEKK